MRIITCDRTLLCPAGLLPQFRRDVIARALHDIIAGQCMRRIANDRQLWVASGIADDIEPVIVAHVLGGEPFVAGQFHSADTGAAFDFDVACAAVLRRAGDIEGQFLRERSCGVRPCSRSYCIT